MADITPIPTSIRAMRAKLGAPRAGDWDIIFEKISQGKHIYDICMDLSLHVPTVINRIKTDPDLTNAYQVANSMFAQTMAYKAMSLAEDVQASDGIAPSRARTAAEIYKWAAAQLDPEGWGKSRVEVTGKNGKDLQMNNVIVFNLPDNGR